MNLRSSFEAKVVFAFAAAVAVVALLFALTWKIAAEATAAANLVQHTHQVINHLVEVKADTLQIELSTQGFRLTGDPAQITERNAVIAAREAVMQRIKHLTTDNPYQQERWRLLREVLDQRLAISRNVEHLRNTEGAAAAQAYAATAPLQATRARTYQLITAMEKEERRLLDDRTTKLQSARDLRTTVGAIVALMLIALLAATYALIRRQLRETEASRQALVTSEENLSTTLQSIGDAVMATDTLGRITRMNRVAEHLTGWSLEQARGRPVDEVFQIVNEMTRKPAEVPVAGVIASGATQGLANHTTLIARDGHEYPIGDSAAPIRDATGQVRGVVLVFRDMTLEREAARSIREQNAVLEQRVEERTAQLRKSEGHLRSVISNVPAMIAYVDSQQRYVYVNQHYLERFAPDREDIVGLTVREVLGEERYAIAEPRIAQALTGHSLSYDWQPFPDTWQVIHYMPNFDDMGHVEGYYVLGTDITARKHAEERIQNLNTALERHVHELDHVSRALRTLSAGNRTMLRATEEKELLDGMCEAIVGTGGYDLAIVWYCIDDAAQSLRPMAQRGYPEGLPALRMLQASWADAQMGQGVVARSIRSSQVQVVRDIHNDPNYAPWRQSLNAYTTGIACPLLVGGEVIGTLAIYDAEPDTFDEQEVALLTESADDLAFGIATLRIRAEQQKNRETMYRLTHFDTLTGLPNETQFTEVLSAALTVGKQQERPFAMLQANIERLSTINDALGFSHGDQMLREFGVRLRSVAPPSAVVARLRGDEFAILLPDSDASTALAMVQRLEDMLQRPLPIADIPLDISAKIGVALFPEHGSTPHDLYRHADIAVHEAKKRGLPHVFFERAFNSHHTQRLTTAGELRRAIENGDLLLYLQPKVEMGTRHLRGAEGLVRWKHASRGIIPPGEFIELAENTGLIKPLTEWVIDTALRLNQLWAREGCALPIAVNLSARNLHDENLLARLHEQIALRDVAPSLLEIEITESTIMEDAEFALRILRGLRSAGIPLYIDDFGTGYSSLSYLQKLPVEHIKIDQSFVHEMSVRKDSELIVRSTIDLVHDLGRTAVAEGVETRENWDMLASLGCDMAQGYFIAKPMPADEFQSWARRYQAPQESDT